MSVELKNPLARWVVHSAECDKLEADDDVGGKGTAFGSHPTLTIKDEGSFPAKFSSGFVSLI